MANVLNGNTYFVDTVSTGATSCLESKDIQVVGIFYHTDTANEHFTLNDIASIADNNAPTVGAKKLQTGSSIAHDQYFVDLSTCPLRFPNGIWISQITAGQLTLVVKFK